MHISIAMPSESSSDNDDQNPNAILSPNSDSMDLSLDAIENQLESISMTSQAETRSSNQQEEQLTIPNGLLNEESRSEVVDEFEEELSNSNTKAGLSSERQKKRRHLLVPVAAGMQAREGAVMVPPVWLMRRLTMIQFARLGTMEFRVLRSSGFPGNVTFNEDDASISWRKRKKHFFILSHSGKPIYARYGDEHKLAGFSATLQAIISFVENGGDRVKVVRAWETPTLEHLGKIAVIGWNDLQIRSLHVVFLVKGPIYLVCISCTEEPYESLRGQLELLYCQMILILTKSLNRCFEKNPKFDMTPLLGGTDAVFSSLIHSFGWNPATFLHAYTCLPLAYATRQTAGAILQDITDSGILFAILMCRHKVISLCGAQKASLHPDDMLLLSNFVMSSESFRTSESFSPICLPRYNPMAFLYAYVHYFDVDTYLILLTTSSDAFYHLKDCRIRIEDVLLESNVLSEVQRSMLDGGMHVEDLPIDPASRTGTMFSHPGQPRPATDSPDRIGDAFFGIGGPAGLWHFIYRSIYLDQYVSSEFSSPINSLRQKKRLFRAYQKLYASMHDKGIGPHKTQFRRDENYVLLCWVTEDFELYAAFDPLADKALAIKTCNRVCQWIKDVENENFLLGASPFSW
ncbi:SAND family protein [Forsythia ovata]|uniref:Vacuolar fusion protein MON1 homolog n=1 Tax=Forsythia ovata TaxID=205694 RepID=A0ABD1X730_9LAMI